MDRLKFLKKFKTFDEWYEIVKDILNDEEFLKRKKFKHHGEVSVYEHCCLVSLKSYTLAKKLHADSRIAAIAGLLHDFYPKAWVDSEELKELDPEYSSLLNKKLPLWKMHGFVHAKEACLNYQKFYPHLVDRKVTNAIKRHMFPLNIVPPRYIESWIITIVDKECSTKDIIHIKGMPKKLVIWFIKLFK